MGASRLAEQKMACANRAREAWTIFWREQGDGSRCLAGLQPEARQSIADHWSGFAAGLRSGACVIDLGCGAGIVGRTLLAARPDVRVTGVDLAAVAPQADGRFEIRGSTSMESLPFSDGTFDAAVSQFGFEYGRVERAAHEMARVLVDGAPFSFLVHHAGGSVVARNRMRARALSELAGDEVRTAFLGGNRMVLDARLATIARDYSGDPLIDQVARALHARAAMGEGDRHRVWDAIGEALWPEREILGALEASCVAPPALDGWLGCFGGRFERVAAEPIPKSACGPVAWRIAGRRRASS